MTSVNTNIAGLTAQYNLKNVNRDMETTMERLSTGKKINSAGDDAAGLAIVSRMRTQINGLNQSIRNANDGISLVKTSEGAINEVSNMLQRMRELAVQASSGTNSDADQATLDLEIQQLKTEIDRIATSTQFNSMNLLDGTFARTLQIGDKAGHSLDVSLESVKIADLGMGSSSTGGSSVVSARINVGSDLLLDGAVVEGTVKINGQDVGAVADNADMEAILKAINDNVDNVTATGFNTVVAKNVGNGVTTVGQFKVYARELGQDATTTFNISASASMDELVANINKETGGVVTASTSSEGKLTLSNETGATIMVADTSSNLGSGFPTGSAGHHALGFGGFIKLTADDSNSVRVEKGNLHDATPGDDDDLAQFGFREVTSETENDRYSLTGIAITSAGVTGGWTQTDLTINGVAIYDSDIATTSFSGKLDAINNFSSETNVTATANFEKSFDFSGITFTATDQTYINGTAVIVGANIAALVTNINAATGPTGITATQNGSNIVLSGAFQSVEIRNSDQDSDAAAGATYFGAIAAGQASTVDKIKTYYGSIRLDSTANEPISVKLGDSAAVAEHGFLEANVGAADYEVNEATLGVSAGSTVAGLSVATGSAAANALKTLDNAINKVDSIRSELGALNNRLDYTVTNLSNIVLNTQAAKSQIEDANFADETTNLIKGQILAQAATSMLAQANQSKQALLALLQ